MELMKLINEINPLVSFIHHYQQNEDDSEEVKNERRQNAAKAYQTLFKQECEWFRESVEAEPDRSNEYSNSETDSEDSGGSESIPEAERFARLVVFEFGAKVFASVESAL